MAEPSSSPTLRAAIAELKEEDPSLTVRQVHEALLQLDPQWAGLPLASVKKMCSKLTKAAAHLDDSMTKHRPKGLFEASATASDLYHGDDAVDPYSIPAWSGLGFVPRTADGEACPPLEWCFQAALPDVARVALSLGGGEGAMDAYAQFVYSLFHSELQTPECTAVHMQCMCRANAVCLTLASTLGASILRSALLPSPPSTPPQPHPHPHPYPHPVVHAYEATASMYRAVLEAPDGASLVIDFLQPACACPATVDCHGGALGSVRAAAAGEAVEAPAAGAAAGAAPLLPVRYLHVPHDLEPARQAALLQAAQRTMAPECPHATAAMLAKGVQPPGLVSTVKAGRHGDCGLRSSAAARQPRVFLRPYAWAPGCSIL